MAQPPAAPVASASATTPSSAPSASTPGRKLRSCVVCRSRRVRCDKQSPCSNCRRANIACVLPSTDRPPRWARRLERLNHDGGGGASSTAVSREADPNVAKVMERLRTLENLVTELHGQLEQAHAAAGSPADSSSAGAPSPGSSTQDSVSEYKKESSPTSNVGHLQKRFGRLVVQDVNRSRYVSSGFWSRVNDELDGLKMDTRGLAGDESDSSEDEASPSNPPSVQSSERTPSQRHAFLFRHNLNPSTPELRQFHPLPSQIPFLLDVFSENVNLVLQIVHMPTITKMVRDMRGSSPTSLTPANEALMFSIYYATITSMEEDDIVSNFGSSKDELSLKFRLGLEHALAKADFLNAPDIVLLQAFVLFLCLVRRHDSPRYVWMMTGLVIRMAQYLGLQRDGAHFDHLTPYEIEMRRKVWWNVCMLDVRASEDQGTEITIASGSYDTRIPLNLNDADIDPESKHIPTERDGVADMTFARIGYGFGETTRQIMVLMGKDGAESLEEQSRLLNEIYRKFEQDYFQFTLEPGHILCWVAVTVARLVMAKLTLIVFFPVLFSSPDEQVTDDLRTKLLVAAIEVAEYNHELNATQACRQWRWVYQTHTHWHAIVYLLIELTRRPWSPTVERAWAALQSSWLIPRQTPTEKTLRIWVPLRKLMVKARKHRDAELDRLRADPSASARLESEDLRIPLPLSSGSFPAGSAAGAFRERWRQLVAVPQIPLDGSGPGNPSVYSSQPTPSFTSGDGQSDWSSSASFSPSHLAANGKGTGQDLGVPAASHPATAANIPSRLPFDQTVEPLYNTSAVPPVNQTDGRSMGWNSVPWLWADASPSADIFANLNVDASGMDLDALDGDIDWYSWIESAKGMQWDAGGLNGSSLAP